MLPFSVVNKDYQNEISYVVERQFFTSAVCTFCAVYCSLPSLSCLEFSVDTSIPIWTLCMLFYHRATIALQTILIPVHGSFVMSKLKLLDHIFRWRYNWFTEKKLHSFLKLVLRRDCLSASHYTVPVSHKEPISHASRVVHKWLWLDLHYSKHNTPIRWRVSWIWQGLLALAVLTIR